MSASADNVISETVSRAFDIARDKEPFAREKTLVRKTSAREEDAFETLAREEPYNRASSIARADALRYVAVFQFLVSTVYYLLYGRIVGDGGSALRTAFAGVAGLATTLLAIDCTGGG